MEKSMMNRAWLKKEMLPAIIEWGSNSKSM